MRNVVGGVVALAFAFSIIITGMGCTPVGEDIVPIYPWDCEIAPFGYRCGFVKHEWKEISWPGGRKNVDVKGNGMKGYKINFNCSIIGVDSCWPLFMSPVIDDASSTWSQDTWDFEIDCIPVDCAGRSVPDCWRCIRMKDLHGKEIVNQHTVSGAGLCAPRYRCNGGICIPYPDGIYTTPNCNNACQGGGGGSGDGSGGGGDSGGGGGGCVDCDCYYETSYTYVQQGEGSDCWARYSQTRYICGGQIRWETDAEFDGLECGNDFQ